MNKHTALIREMILYENHCPQRVHHFLKVYSFAKQIAEMEEIDQAQKYTLETAAIVHDIGIRESFKKYGKCNGKLQEKEGPYIAKPILRKLGFDENVIERVCYLIAHHHTYTNVDGIDYQILLEADFLVNILEDDLSSKASVNVLANVFKTKTGIEFFNSMYSQWKVNIE